MDRDDARQAPARLDSAAGPAQRTSLRVRPRFCDAQGMVHAARYYEFFEDAFIEWLDEHVGGYARLREAGTDLVVVASGCEHANPARLDDRLTVHAQPERRGRTSLTMSYVIRRGETLIVTGRTTYVAVAGETGSVPLPEPLTAALDGGPGLDRATERSLGSLRMVSPIRDDTTAPRGETR
ncbi:MAG TPA: thioesterase family protein [Streptosporangiaceae bacterium]|jgi:YbgC/YbaW family acyl-CoA thioester hydrolase